NLLGRIVQTQKNVLPPVLPGNATVYITRSIYDSLGRMKSIVYPDNTIVNYAYNGPFLDRVYDLGTVYVSYSGYNALGQPAHQAFGNGVTTDFTYANASNGNCPAPNFRPCTTTTFGATGRYQDFSYYYDQGG